MKRLVMYLVPLMMMVMLFLAVPAELMAETWPDTPWSHGIRLDYDDADSSVDYDIPYFTIYPGSDPADLMFAWCTIRNTNNTDGDVRGIIATESHHSWDVLRNVDYVIPTFYEESVQDSYFELEWLAVPNGGFAEFDVSVDEDI